jgi:MinD superfamily P-loop ATPase
MACAGVCPTQALTSGGSSPGLSFTESRCNLCGACARICPEHCIALNPRLILDIRTAATARVLVEAEPLQCIRCGTAFGSRAMIERLTAKLADHWMYRRPQDFRRLHMCGTCRVREIFSVQGDES